MRGGAGVNIVGSFVNITSFGSTTLHAEVNGYTYVCFICVILRQGAVSSVTYPCGAMEARWTSNSKVVGSSPIRGVHSFFFSFLPLLYVNYGFESHRGCPCFSFYLVPFFYMYFTSSAD